MTLASTPACVFDEGGELEPSAAETAEENADPIIVDGVLEPGMQLDGEYELTTHFDLTEGELLPEVGSEILSTLTDLRENPTATLVSLLSAANIPIVGTVLDMIPPAIEDALFEAMDQVVFEKLFEQVPVTEKLAQLVDDIATITTDFEVVTELEIDSGEGRKVELGHQLSGVAFRLGGQRYLIQLPGEAAAATRTIPIAGHALYTYDSDSAEDGLLYMDTHGMPLPLGELALQGINTLLQNTMGAADLRDALGTLVDCEVMGASVDNACLLGCSMLATAVEDMCTTGLDTIVFDIEDRMRDIRFDSMHFVGGEAALFDRALSDASVDHRIDRIDHGRWDLLLARDADSAPIAATGEFSGYRIGIDLEREEFDLIDIAQRIATESPATP